MKAFLTGGTGLLGCFLAKYLSDISEVVVAGHKNTTNVDSQKTYTTLDITNYQDFSSAFNQQNFTHLIHSAALRYPEDCLKDPNYAYKVNSVAVEYAAELANKQQSKLVYISTDYVFSGFNPPYKITDCPDPINIYGRSKLAGEFATKSANNYLIVRVPALWYNDPKNWRSPVKGFLEKFKLNKPFNVENTLVRHYTSADDIAKAVVYLLQNNIKGIVHLSASESQTKADFARSVGIYYGYDPNLVINSLPSINEDRRPQDSTLDTSYYQSLGGPSIRNVSEILVKD